MFVASCFPLRSGKASSGSDLCHINAVNLDKPLYLRDECHVFRRSNAGRGNENVQGR
ncbi:hypothetical protein ENTCAN_09491 [Enterobacter cancerogenus ATCC 35316]|nr:hypothetical protein ENTCAN_09491 [Enterobacter cancerogenus ATCC 35316]